LSERTLLLKLLGVMSDPGFTLEDEDGVEYIRLK
jgi:hypothetical protein